jgi:hypothetical protein
MYEAYHPCVDYVRGASPSVVVMYEAHHYQSGKETILPAHCSIGDIGFQRLVKPKIEVGD